MDFQSDINRILENVKDMSGAMAMLLETLTYDLGQPNKLQLSEHHLENSNTLLNSYYCLFRSYLGVSVISETITQISLLKFSICRNLLILQQIILTQTDLFDSQSLHVMKSSLASRTVVLTQAYYIIMWICKCNAFVPVPQGLL